MDDPTDRMGDHEGGDGLEFRLLGPMELRVGGQRLRVPGPRQRRLLAALLLDPDRVVTSEALVDAVWDEAPPDTARRQLHNAIAALRRRLPALRPVLLSHEPGYRIAVPGDRVDAHRFTRAVDAARAAAAGDSPDGGAARAAAARQLRDALGLWRGPALADLTGGGGGPAGTGGPIEAAAARLEEQRLDAHELLMQLRLADGESAALVPELTRLFDAHPLREGFAAQLMLALYRSGRQPKALAVYERTRATLADELGIDPRPDLRALHHRMLRGDPALTALPGPRRPTGGDTATPPTPPAGPEPAPAPASAPAPPQTLPYDIADFTGRGAEVDDVLRAVNAPDTATGLSITVLDGMPGIGKTTLAVRVAHLAADRYPDGRLFVNLHGHSPDRAPLTPDATLGLLLRQLGVPPEHVPDAHEERVARWRSEMAGRRALLVLDNAADEAQVRPLLPGTATAAVLVTSRLRLTALEGARPLSLDLLPHHDAVALFRQVSRLPEGDGDAGDASDAVDTVVALCGHLPLAIRIAASRLHHRPAWTVAHLAHRMRDERGRLAELAVGDRGVRAAFAVSHRQLAPDAQTLFRRLGLHPGPDLDAYDAAALLDAPVDEAERLLESLTTAHLLTEHAAGRYHVHDLLASYARALAEAEEPEAERRAAALRLTEHYLCLGHAIEELVDPGSPLAARDAGRRSEFPTLRTIADAKAAVAFGHRTFVAAIENAHAHGLSRQATRLAEVLCSCLLRHGYVEEALAGYTVGLRAARLTRDADVEAAIHRGVGYAHVSTGRFAKALRAFRQGLAIERERGDEVGAARILRTMSSAHYRLGEYHAALETLRPVVDVMRRAGSAWDMAAALANLGVVYTQLGAYDEAIAAQREVLALEPHSHRARVLTLFNLGWAHSRKGELEVAEEYMRESLRLGREADSAEGEARSRAHLADCLLRQGRAEEALAECRAALDLAEGIDSPDVRSLALGVLGQIHYALGDLPAARSCFDRALRTTEGVGLSYRRAIAHDGRAKVAAAQGRPELALHHWRRALELAEECGVPEADAIRRHISEVERAAPPRR
ncbi:AfsR/SARP family transcriptional regulator [Streptomyces sp. 6N223]|uniref:AfsR/SARP family transcriptional regulator n=1 Tax=Streptomyces sp. 6N223 TaxID=3457412 RepID=UPI003FD50B65